MFGFIKNLFGGIFAFFGGLFGSKKSKADSSAPKARKGSGGYYIVLDEAQTAQSANGKQTAKAEAVKVEPAAKPEPAKASAPAAAAKPAKVEAAPKPEPVKAPAPATPSNGKSPQLTATFAPDYLLSLSSTNGRRRPGANMNSYLELARQVKTR